MPKRPLPVEPSERTDTLRPTSGMTVKNVPEFLPTIEPPDFVEPEGSDDIPDFDEPWASDCR